MPIERKKQICLKSTIALAIAIITAFALGLYFAILEQRATASGIFRMNPLSVIRMEEWFVVFFAVLIILTLMFFYRKETCHYLFKYRFIIAAIIFILCVILEFNGSSFRIWEEIITGKASAPLIGVNRGIRSDEWMVFTPMALSQYVNPLGSFNYFNSLLRATPTDLFMVYGQAVKDIAMIFRPFQIGYLFLSEGKGMAFFWCGRIIALFLVSFEFGRFLTKDQKALSVAYAALLTFSPVVQWWFSVNGFVEMLIAGQLMIVLTDHYIDDHEALWKKAVYPLSFFICAGIFAFTLYPSWQIPLAFIFFAIFVWILVTKRKSICISIIDGFFLGLGALILITVSAHVFSQSWDTIQTVIHTTYPGNRMDNGGKGFIGLLNYPLSVYFSVKTKCLNQNVCEESFFYDFFPLGLLFSLYAIFKEKKKDGVSIILLIFCIIFIVRLIVPWPEWMSKFTLMSKVSYNRLVVIVSWINLLLLIRGISLVQNENINQKNPWLFVRATIAFSAVMLLIATIIQKNYVSPMIFVFAFGVLTLGTLGIFLYHRSYGKKLMLVGILVICFFSGMTVNPLNRGLDTVKSQSLYQNIVQTNEKNDIWIVESGLIPLGNYPVMAGAATINSTNTYPNMEKWRTLTSDTVYHDIINRYAHIVVNINPEVDFMIRLHQFDVVLIDMNPSYLKKLKVTKILSERDLTDLSTNEVKFTKIAQDSKFYIYKVN